MIQTNIIPTNEASLNLSLNLPTNYIGKLVHVLIYAEDEVKNDSIPTLHKKKPSDYFGTLSKEEGEKLHKHVAKCRKEWERDI